MGSQITHAIAFLAGVGGTTLIAIGRNAIAQLVRDDRRLHDAIVPAADYWAFVYGAVKRAETQGNSGAARMAVFMDMAERFLDECDLRGDARRVTIARMRHDAEMVVGFFKHAQALPTLAPAIPTHRAA
jgi:hypothetical protein